MRNFQFSVLLVAMAAFYAEALTSKVQFVDPTNGKTVRGNLVPYGCFNVPTASRYFPVSKLYHNGRDNDLDWSKYPDFGAVVEECAKQAYLQKMQPTFGIQFYGECWGSAAGGSAPASSFSGIKQSPGLCDHGVGKGNAFFIYRLQVLPDEHDKKCNINGGVYKDGEIVYLPNNWTDIGDAKCMKCECSAGKPKGCTLHSFCDYPLGTTYCEKWETKPRACCPTCACTHKGKQMHEDDVWAARVGSECHECKCSQGISTCRKTVCLSCSPGYERGDPIPEICCAPCKPKPTTPRPTFIIPTTTTRRPPPTFPPFPQRR